MPDMSYAALADQYRNQRDVLAEALAFIVNDDAAGKGFYANVAQKALERMAATTEKAIPPQEGSAL